MITRDTHKDIINNVNEYLSILRSDNKERIESRINKLNVELTKAKEKLEEVTVSDSNYIIYYTNKVKHKQEVLDSYIKIRDGSFTKYDFFLDDLYKVIYGSKYGYLDVWNLLMQDSESVSYKLHVEAHERNLPSLKELIKNELKDYYLFLFWNQLLSVNQKLQDLQSVNEESNIEYEDL